MKYKAFHKLSYGLYIITTRLNNENAGYIGNTVFQVTSSPSQIVKAMIFVEGNSLFIT